MTSSTVTINQNAKDGAVIFLHGLGDTCHGWAAAFDAIKQPNIKYILPTAPSIPVSLNGGMSMPAWFDIHGLSENDKQDKAGIVKSTDFLLDLVQKEADSGIDRRKIVIGGFSQGGAVALHALMMSKEALGGVMALSSWLPLSKEMPPSDKLSQVNKEIAILQCHGDLDPMVSLSFGKASAEAIRSKLGFSKLTFKLYSNMMHGSCDQEMSDVKNFISTIIPS